MKNRNTIVRLIAILSIILIIGYFIKDRLDKKQELIARQEQAAEEQAEEEKKEQEENGEKAPEGLIIGERLKEFKTVDRDGKEQGYKDLDGELVELDDFKGKITLVNFWASWCIYCEKEMPDLVRLQESYDDVEVVTINVGDSEEEARAYIEDGGYDLKVVLDEDGLLGQEFLVSAFPATYFVDQQGRFMGRVPSMMTYEDMELIVKEIRENKMK